MKFFVKGRKGQMYLSVYSIGFRQLSKRLQNGLQQT